MKKIWLWFHLHLGLLFLPVLLMLGVSTLYINHQFDWFKENRQWTEEPSVTVALSEIDDQQFFAEYIRDSLELSGWAPWWTQRNENGHFTFTLDHPGSEHLFDLNRETSVLSHKKRSKGWGATWLNLHFHTSDIPNGDAVVNLWPYYLNTSALYTLFAVLSGIILFMKRKSERIAGLVICAISLLGVVSFLFSLWWIG